MCVAAVAFGPVVAGAFEIHAGPPGGEADVGGYAIFPVEVAEAFGDIALRSDDQNPKRHVDACKGGDQRAIGTVVQIEFAVGALVKAVIAAADADIGLNAKWKRSEEHTSELQSLMRISYAVFCLKKKN